MTKIKIKPRPSLDNLTPYKPGKAPQDLTETRLTPLKLSSNENPYGSPVSANDLQTCLNNAHTYPHQASASLLAKLCAKHGINPNQLILGNGSDEVLQLIAATYLGPDDDVVIPAYTFSVYHAVSLVFDAQIKLAPMPDLHIDLDAVLAAVTPTTKVVFICSPNNPTGTYLPMADIRKFLDKLPKNVLAVLDEAYVEFVTDESREGDVYGLISDHSNLIILRTFSKLYGLAGLRVGYGVGDAQVIADMQKVKAPFNVNSVALAAASLALDNHDYLEKSLSNNLEQRQRVTVAISEMGLQVLPSQANFICIDLGKLFAKEVADALASQGILVRALTSFNLPHHLRVTIGRPEDNDRVLSALSHLISKSKE